MASRNVGRDVRFGERPDPPTFWTVSFDSGKIGRIVFGTGRDDAHAMYFENQHFDIMDFIRDAYGDNISLNGGLMLRECAALMCHRAQTFKKTNSLAVEPFSLLREDS
jgi:hypothetical protein